jgi:hypothetical protein
MSIGNIPFNNSLRRFTTAALGTDRQGPDIALGRLKELVTEVTMNAARTGERS